MYNKIGKTSFDLPRSLITTLKTFPIRLDTPSRRLLVFVNFRAYRTLPVVVVATLLCHFVFKGIFDVFLTSKEENLAFSAPSPSCNVMPLFELSQENCKHPNFEWRGQGRVLIFLFFEVSLFEYNVSINFSPIVRSDSRWHFDRTGLQLFTPPSI